MKKIVAVLAHPDDAEIWMGGTILNHLQKGDKILIIYLFAENEERKKEARLFEQYLNLNVKFASQTEDVRIYIKKYEPDVIITHWNKDSHFQHRAVYEMVEGLIPKLILEDHLEFNLYMCDTYNSIGIINELYNPNVYIDISENWMKKVKLIMNHRSQPTKYWISMIRNQNSLFGSRILTSYAEGFIHVETMGFFRKKIRYLE